MDDVLLCITTYSNTHAHTCILHIKYDDFLVGVISVALTPIMHYILSKESCIIIVTNNRLLMMPNAIVFLNESS